MSVLGLWNTEAPLDPEDSDADVLLLQEITNNIPEGVIPRTLEFWVNGHPWEWVRYEVPR